MYVQGTEEDFISRVIAGFSGSGRFLAGHPVESDTTSMGTCAPRASQLVCPAKESSEQTAICGPH